MTFAELLPEITKLDLADKIRVMQIIVSELAVNELAIQPNAAPLASPLEASGVLDVDTERALAYYHAELAKLLEPAHNGDDVAIHPDTLSYEVAKGTGHAYRALRAKQPIGSIIVHRIGIADLRLSSSLEHMVEICYNDNVDINGANSII